MANDVNILSTYLKEINRIPLLSNEEETELALKAAKGDKLAKNKIVSANLRFVVSVAKKYQNKGLELEDLISEGNVGLLIAIDKFDVSKGYHFISYAVWWIRQAILKAISEKGRSIRLPQNRLDDISQIEFARKELASAGDNLSEEAELKEVAAMLQMNVVYVREMVNISRDMASLDSEVRGRDSSLTTLGDMVEDDTAERPEEVAMKSADIVNSQDETLKATIEAFTSADVLRMRYGLNGQKPMSLKEVGDTFNLTKERIRQIEQLALRRLRHPTRMRRLESYVA